MTDAAKIPEPLSKTPRCPLCYAAMEKMHNEQVAQRVQQKIAQLVAEAKKCDLENDRKGREKAKHQLEVIDAALKRGLTFIFSCHFCKIACAANDPFAGKWEMAYAQAGKETCVACETEMRFFCTATGVAILDCPNKKCRARIKRSLPDRLKDAPVVLVDEKGDPIDMPNISGAVSAPGQLADSQVNAPGDDALPTVNIPLKEGHA